MEEFFSAVANLGFPIAVASYLLIRFERKIDKLDDSISGRDGLIVWIKKLVEQNGKK